MKLIQKIMVLDKSNNLVVNTLDIVIQTCYSPYSFLTIQ